jgi:hypothetical protein
MTVHNGRNERQHADQTDALPNAGGPRQPSEDGNDDRDRATSRTGRKRRTAIRVAPPGVVAMDRDDERQAVTAIATMIASWWHEHDYPNEQRTRRNRPRSRPDRTTLA